MEEARTLTKENAVEIAEWCDGILVEELDSLDHSATSPGINLMCVVSVQRASVGDVIIRGHDGKFRIYK